MTIILTAPERIALMAYDASTGIKGAGAWFTEIIDEANRPFVLVEVAQGDYPPVAAGVEECTEEFTLTLFAQSYGQGSKFQNEAERELRSVTASFINYFQKRSQLQFSNSRNVSTLAPLGGLLGVGWARLYMRSYVGAVTKGGDAGEGAFWGTTFSLRVFSFARAEEVII